jgi:hypothetical protein
VVKPPRRPSTTSLGTTASAAVRRGAARRRRLLESYRSALPPLLTTVRPRIPPGADPPWATSGTDRLRLRLALTSDPSEDDTVRGAWRGPKPSPPRTTPADSQVPPPPRWSRPAGPCSISWTSLLRRRPCGRSPAGVPVTGRGGAAVRDGRRWSSQPTAGSPSPGPSPTRGSTTRRPASASAVWGPAVSGSAAARPPPR